MIGERKSRLCLADVRGGEMNEWQTNPKGRLQGGYRHIQMGLYIFFAKGPQISAVVV